jgi:NTE family protein
MIYHKPFVLSGGGVRGLAHLGVIKALHEVGIQPSEISATSAGAIIGAFLADGFTTDEIKELFLNKLNLNVFSMNTFRFGLISIKRMREFIEKNLRHTLFEELSMPLYVSATNFIDGRQHVFHEGSMLDVIMASCSIPVLFSPVMINGIPYVDGGLSNNLPVEPFAQQKNEIVSIYVNPLKVYNANDSLLELIDRSVHLGFREMVNRSADGCYLFIEPANLTEFGLFEFHKLTTIIDAGYVYTTNFLQHHSEFKP